MFFYFTLIYKKKKFTMVLGKQIVKRFDKKNIYDKED